MPTKNRTKRAAQRTRKSIDPRGRIKRARRQRFKRAIPTTPAILADSIYSLRFKPVALLDIASRQLQNVINGNDYNRVYKDVLACYKNAMKLSGKTVSKFDPLQNNGLSLQEAIQEVTRRFSAEFLPKGFEIDIEMEPDELEETAKRWYYFCINKTIGTPQEFLSFELKSVANYLSKHNPKLHDLYIEVMGQLHYKIGVDTWYTGNFSFDWMIDSLEQEIIEEGDESNYTSEDLEKIIDGYGSGEAYQYQEKLRNTLFTSPEILRAKLSGSKSLLPFRNFLKQAIDLLEMPQKLSMYTYRPTYGEFDVGDCLKVEDQVMIIWNDDMITSVLESFLDSSAHNFGINDFHFAIPFTKNIKQLSTSLLTDQSLEWPEKLRSLQITHQGLVNKLKSKNGNNK